MINSPLSQAGPSRLLDSQDFSQVGVRNLALLHRNVPQLDLSQYLPTQGRGAGESTSTEPQFSHAVQLFQRSSAFDAFCADMKTDIQDLHAACQHHSSQGFANSAWGRLVRRLMLEPGLSDFQGHENHLYPIYQSSCRELRQLAVIARAMAPGADTRWRPNVRGAIVQALKDLSGELDVCGPGMRASIQLAAQKVELLAFPPSLDQHFQRIKLDKFRQFIGEFVARVYANNPGLESNHVHMVNAVHQAWHGLYGLPPPIEDIFAARSFVNDIDPAVLRNAKYDLDGQLDHSQLAQTLAHEILDEIRQQCDASRGDYHQQVTDLLDVKQRTFGPIAVHTVLCLDEDYNARVHHNATLLAVNLLGEELEDELIRSALQRNTHLLQNKNLRLFQFGVLLWLERPQASGQAETSLFGFEDLDCERFNRRSEGLTCADNLNLYPHALHECLRNRGADTHPYHRHTLFHLKHIREQMVAARIVLANWPKNEPPVSASVAVSDADFLKCMLSSRTIGDCFSVEELMKGFATLSSNSIGAPAGSVVFSAERAATRITPIRSVKVFEAVARMAVQSEQFKLDPLLTSLVRGGHLEHAEVLLNLRAPGLTWARSTHLFLDAMEHRPSPSFLKRLCDLSDLNNLQVDSMPLMVYALERFANQNNLKMLVDEYLARGGSYPMLSMDHDPIAVASLLGKSEVLAHMQRVGYWCAQYREEYANLLPSIAARTPFADDVVAQVLDVFLSSGLVKPMPDALLQRFMATCVENQRHYTLAILLRHEGVLNASNSKGYTQLHSAVLNRDLGKALGLLRAGADVHLPTVGHAKKTALHFAYRNQHREMIELLFQFGANPGQPDGKRRLPAHWLARGGPE